MARNWATLLTTLLGRCKERLSGGYAYFAKRPVLVAVLSFLFGSIISSFLSIWVTTKFQELNRAVVLVEARDPTIAQLGTVQALRDSKVVKEEQFASGGGKNSAGSLTLKLDPGYYELRLNVVRWSFQLARRRFDRRSRARFDDSRIKVKPFFDGSQFVLIPAGEFLMGSAEFADSRPHRVYLDVFYIRSIPVTECEYNLFLLRRRSEAASTEPCVARSGQFPAVWVTWRDAVEFCEWLSELKGRKYRLPTEAEYERAMRIAGANYTFPWGDDEFDPQDSPKVPRANYLYVWKKRGEAPRVMPVSQFGSIKDLYDIAGNVWSWTQDGYERDFYRKPEASGKNPLSPGSSASGEKVVRGGSCQDPVEKLKPAFRGKADPQIGYYNVGFRVVMEP